MRWKSDLILLFVAAIWGSGFVAQRLAAQAMSTFYFNGGRFLIAALLLYALLRLQRKPKIEARALSNRRLMPWMAVAGVLLFAASGLQQAGLATTSIGNASFITGMYVVLVPIILSVFWNQRVTWQSWLAVGLSVLGIMLLSLQAQLRLSPGDMLELIGAVTWALHVILVGRLAGLGADVLTFSAIQFAICGVLNLALALGLDPTGTAHLISTWPAVLYSAVVPIGLGFTLQITGQRNAPTVDAAILLSMEAVFGTLFGFLFLGESLTPQQMFGCGLILAAIILSQIRPLKETRKEPA